MHPCISDSAEDKRELLEIALSYAYRLSGGVAVQMATQLFFMRILGLQLRSPYLRTPSYTIFSPATAGWQPQCSCFRVGSGVGHFLVAQSFHSSNLDDCSCEAEQKRNGVLHACMTSRYVCSRVGNC